MLYQIFREQKQHGRSSENMENKNCTFNAAEFDQLIGKYSQHLQSANPTDWYDFQQPNDPVGFSQINIYKCALVNMLREQQALNVNNLSWTTDIWQEDLRSMFDFAHTPPRLVHTRDHVD